MRFSHVTPHQYQSLAPYVDTLLLTSHSPEPLDVATPHAASAWIAADISQRAAERFVGRIATVQLGAIFLHTGFTPALLDTLDSLAATPVRYGVLLTDRTLTRDICHVRSAGGVAWIAVDWWQWLRQRVPTERQADAWMYLAHAHTSYLGSGEQKRLGLPEDITNAMAQQGRDLQMQVVEFVCNEVRSLWSSAPSTWPSASGDAGEPAQIS